jgi:hypothetical protein
MIQIGYIRVNGKFHGDLGARDVEIETVAFSAATLTHQYDLVISLRTSTASSFTPFRTLRIPSIPSAQAIKPATKRSIHHGPNHSLLDRFPGSKSEDLRSTRPKTWVTSRDRGLAVKQ